MATPPLNKDVKEVIKEISKAPFGKASKPDKSRPMLTLAETEKTKEAAKKVSPVTVKKKAAKLTAKEKDKAIKQIAKERGISYNQAKEALRTELSRAPNPIIKQQPLQYKNTEKVSGGNEGKGTPIGDAKDIKMRSVANFAIVELENTQRQSLGGMSNIIDKSKSSSETTLREVGPVPKDADLRGKTIVLARNGKLVNKPLRPETIDQITKAVKAGARFVVGDMPGVDSKFVKLLNDLKANYTVYHTGDKPRFAQEEVVISRKPTSIKQPTVILPKGIPFRSEIEDVAPRAVSYKGKTIYLTPGQIIAMGLKPDILPSTSLKGLTVGALPEDTYLTKGEQSFLTQEKMKTASNAATEARYRDFLGVEPRAARDAQETLNAERLRSEAAKDWSNQARAAATNPEVRNPAEALGKATPDSAKAEAYAERLFQKAYKELSPKERKDIKIIIEEENRKAQKVTRSTVGAKMDEQKVVRPGVKRYRYKGSTPPIVPKMPIPKIIGPLGYIGMAAEMFFSYKLMLQQDAERRQQEAMN
jgi:hypothetical protein